MTVIKFIAQNPQWLLIFIPNLFLSYFIFKILRSSTQDLSDYPLSPNNNNDNDDDSDNNDDDSGNNPDWPEPVLDLPPGVCLSVEDEDLVSVS